MPKPKPAANPKLAELDRQRAEAHAQLSRESPVYRAFLDMEHAAFSDGALPKKVKELCALSISVVIHCESCMQWHLRQAARSGATRAEILEAVEVGMEMGGGPATVSARFALEVLEAECGPRTDEDAPPTAPKK